MAGVSSHGHQSEGPGELGRLFLAISDRLRLDGTLPYRQCQCHRVMATVVVLRTGLSWLKDVRQSGKTMPTLRKCAEEAQVRGEGMRRGLHDPEFLTRHLASLSPSRSCPTG